MAVIYAAGGGTEVFPWLLARGGGSATLLAGRIPYDPADFVAILGARPWPPGRRPGRPGAGHGRIPPRSAASAPTSEGRESSESGPPRS